MNTKDFDNITKARQAHTQKTLLAKGEEYSKDADRLYNFYAAARLNELTAAQSLWGMLTKHIISVKDIVDNTAHGVYPNEEMIDEKIGDIINYMHLLEAALIEGKCMSQQAEVNIARPSERYNEDQR